MNLDFKNFFLNNSLLFVFFFICIVGTLTSEYFFTLTNLQNMVRNMAVPGLLALGVSIKANMGVFQITAENSSDEYSWGGSFNTSSKRKTASITMRLNYEID